MLKSLYTSYNALIAHQTDLDVTANNIANINTVGYKRTRAEFEDLLYQNANLLQAAPEKPVGSGVMVNEIGRIFSQGNVIPTGRELDVAIEGEGFFQLQLPNGELVYTRDGTFHVDANGRIVNSRGYFLVPAITLPPNTTAVGINPAGNVSVTTANAPAPINVGTITLARFVNAQGLQALGGNIFKQSVSSGEPLVNVPTQGGAGSLRQNSVEVSNVDIGTELTHMLLASNAFQFNTRAVTVSNEMLQTANDMVRF